MEIRYYGDKISEHIAKTPEGFLICQDVPISRTGYQSYLASEIMENPKDGHRVIHVYRPASEVFNEKSLASFEGKPVCNEHPQEDITPENFHKFACGHVQNVHMGKGPDANKVLADLYITDPVLIRLIKDGKREISCGYYAEEKRDSAGRLCQTKIRGNHVAVVNSARAGKSVCIRDHNTTGKRNRLSLDGYDSPRHSLLSLGDNWLTRLKPTRREMRMSRYYNSYFDDDEELDALEDDDLLEEDIEDDDDVLEEEMDVEDDFDDDFEDDDDVLEEDIEDDFDDDDDLESEDFEDDDFEDAFYNDISLAGIGKGIGKGISKVGGGMGKLGKSISGKMKSGAAAKATLRGKIGKAISRGGNAVQEAGASVGRALGKAGKSAGEALSKVGGKIKTGFRGIKKSKFGQGVASGVDAVKGAAGKVGGAVKNNPVKSAAIGAGAAGLGAGIAAGRASKDSWYPYYDDRYGFLYDDDEELTGVDDIGVEDDDDIDEEELTIEQKADSILRDARRVLRDAKRRLRRRDAIILSDDDDELEEAEAEDVEDDDDILEEEEALEDGCYGDDEEEAYGEQFDDDDDEPVDESDEIDVDKTQALRDITEATRGISDPHERKNVQDAVYGALCGRSQMADIMRVTRGNRNARMDSLFGTRGQMSVAGQQAIYDSFNPHKN